MITTTYECDRCHAKQNTSDQMWGISVQYQYPENDPFMGRTWHNKKDELWCRKCMEKFGLLPSTRPKSKEEMPKPTMEDFLREIIRLDMAGRKRPHGSPQPAASRRRKTNDD